MNASCQDGKALMSRRLNYCMPCCYCMQCCCACMCCCAREKCAVVFLHVQQVLLAACHLPYF